MAANNVLFWVIIFLLILWNWVQTIQLGRLTSKIERLDAILARHLDLDPRYVRKDAPDRDEPYPFR